jgi:DNA repair protein RadC
MEQTTKRLKYRIVHQELELKKYTLNVNSMRIANSRDGAEMASQLIDTSSIEIYESFYAIFLNRRNSVVSMATISKGGTSGTVVDSKMIFRHALLANASGIILVHNHPSGNNKPSEADIQLTKKLKQAAVELDIAILDHLIMCPVGGVCEPGFNYTFFSFADEGLL